MVKISVPLEDNMEGRNKKSGKELLEEKQMKRYLR